MSIQPFNMEVDRPGIEHLMEVSIMLDICRYCIFTLYINVYQDNFKLLPHIK